MSPDEFFESLNELASSPFLQHECPQCGDIWLCEEVDCECPEKMDCSACETADQQALNELDFEADRDKRDDEEDDEWAQRQNFHSAF